MALIDVSELMYDPDFCDYFNYSRRMSTVNNFGETMITETPMRGYGSMQPISKGTLQLFPDLQRTDGMMELYTTTALTVTTNTGLISDVVLWNGLAYIVNAVADDFSNWGAGYFVAVLVQLNLQNADPAAIPHTEFVP